MNYFKNAKFFRCMALALLALTCFVGSNSVNAADGYAQKREMRSVWIATVFNIDWPKANHYGNPDLMKADLIAYFDACKTQTSIPFVFRCVLCVMHSTNQVMNHGRVT